MLFSALLVLTTTGTNTLSRWEFTMANKRLWSNLYRLNWLKFWSLWSLLEVIVQFEAFRLGGYRKRGRWSLMEHSMVLIDTLLWVRTLIHLQLHKLGEWLGLLLLKEMTIVSQKTNLTTALAATIWWVSPISWRIRAATSPTTLRAIIGVLVFFCHLSFPTCSFCFP